jgi:hypothetical protein
MRRESVALKRFKDLMKKNSGKLSFAGHASKAGSELRGAAGKE